MATKGKTPTPSLDNAAPDSVVKQEGFKQLTVEALENLIEKDPEQAQRYLDLFEKLKGYKKEMVEKEGLIKTQYMVYQNLVRNEQLEYNKQQACGAHGHLRDDNRSALVGQRDNFHNVILVCQRCQKRYSGLGGETGVPIHLVGTIDMSLVGGVQ